MLIGRWSHPSARSATTFWEFDVPMSSTRERPRGSASPAIALRIKRALCALGGLLSVGCDFGNEPTPSIPESIVFLSTSGIVSGRPTWDPTGSRLAFVGMQAIELRGIYVVDSDGSDLRLVSRQENVRELAWSPLGEVLAFSERTVVGGRVSQTIGLINADGSGKRILTDGPLDLSPCWSPDGRYIAYTSHDDGDAEVYVLDTSSGVRRRLTTSRAFDGRASWGPGPSR
jgi:Tol biopolymer transport system component